MNEMRITEFAEDCWAGLKLGPGWEKRLTAQIETAIRIAVTEERAKIMQFLNNTAQAQRELARIEVEDYGCLDAAEAAQKVAEAIDHIICWMKARVPTASTEGGNE